MFYEQITCQPIYKIILIGSYSVGKTTLCNTLQGRIFDERTPITIGVDFAALELIDNNQTKRKYKIQLWDTAGHETFRSIAKTYYRNSHIILLCFDLTNRSSFAELDTWMDEINSIIDKHVCICILGLKSDLTPSVYKSDIDSFLEKYSGLSYKSYTSKYDNNAENIKNILFELIEEYKKFKKIDDKEEVIMIDDENTKKNKERKKCCMSV